MKKTLLWVFGILLVVAVVAGLFAIPFVMRSTMFANNFANGAPQGRVWNQGPMMDGNRGWQHPAVPGYQGDFGMRPQGRQSFGFNGRVLPFGGGFMLLGGLLRLIPLALFGLLLYGVYQLGKRSGMRAATAPVSYPAQAAAPATPEAPAAEPSETALK